MSPQGGGAVLVIAAPGGNLAQRVDSYAAVLALAVALEAIVPAEKLAGYCWEVVGDNTVRDAMPSGTAAA